MKQYSGVVSRQYHEQVCEKKELEFRRELDKVKKEHQDRLVKINSNLFKVCDLIFDILRSNLNEMRKP